MSAGHAITRQLGHARATPTRETPSVLTLRWRLTARAATEVLGVRPATPTRALVLALRIEMVGADEAGTDAGGSGTGATRSGSVEGWLGRDGAPDAGDEIAFDPALLGLPARCALGVEPSASGELLVIEIAGVGLAVLRPTASGQWAPRYVHVPGIQRLGGGRYEFLDAQVR